MTLTVLDDGLKAGPGRYRRGEGRRPWVGGRRRRGWTCWSSTTSPSSVLTRPTRWTSELIAARYPVRRHRRDLEPGAVERLGLMADPLLAQSVIDRLQSAAYELSLDGESYAPSEAGTQPCRRGPAHLPDHPGR